MHRVIRAGHSGMTSKLQIAETGGKRYSFPLSPSVNRCDMKPVVAESQQIKTGECLARGERLEIHSPVTGVIESVNDDAILVRADKHQQETAFVPAPSPTKDTLYDYGVKMGLAGMGGSMFPASVKLSASVCVHTLVINAVECEPGIQIDEALMIQEFDRVRAGVEALQNILSLDRVVLADKETSSPEVRERCSRHGWQHLKMPGTYPAGAERLIIGKLMGRIPPAGFLPFTFGYIVLSGASLWALGRAVTENRPSIDRPLTVVLPERPSVNLIAPVGMSIEDVLKSQNFILNSNEQIVIAGGRMMGRQVSTDTPLLKGTNAVIVVPKDERWDRPEEPCVLCGSCFDVCPLHLHPISMADRIRKGQPSAALQAHLQECFLCGACSAVCPADIPLVQIFHKGKEWIKNNS
jgi:electron transport complex protein RnfC